MPGAKFLVIVRHPLDVIASMIRVGERLDETNTPGHLPFDDIRALCRGYVNIYAPVVTAQYANEAFSRSMMWIRYKDLVAAPRVVIDAIGKFTGLAFKDFNSDAEWRVHSERSLDPEGSTAWRSDLWGKGISNRRIGDFRRTLTDEQSAIVRRECREAIECFQYTETEHPKFFAT